MKSQHFGGDAEEAGLCSRENLLFVISLVRVATQTGQRATARQLSTHPATAAEGVGVLREKCSLRCPEMLEKKQLIVVARLRIGHAKILPEEALLQQALHVLWQRLEWVTDDG